MILELAAVGGASYVVRRVRRPRLIDRLVPNHRRDWATLKKQTEIMSEEEREARQYFLQTSVMMGSAVVSMVVFPASLYLLIPGIAYTTYPLLRDAWRDLREEHRLTVVGVDVILSALTLMYSVINPQVLALTTFSNWLYSFFLKVIATSKSNAKNQLAHLAVVEPEQIWVLQDGVEIAIAFAELKVGDVLVLEAGQTVPVDGVVCATEVLVVQSLLTGETEPVTKHVGDTVFAGSVLHAGRLQLQVEKMGSATALAELRHVFDNSALYAADVELRGKALADRFALPGVALSVLAYPVGGLNAVLAVMMMSPCYNMRLFGLLTVMEFLQAAAQEGILIKDGRVLEQVDKIDTVILDLASLLVLDESGEVTLRAGTLEGVNALRTQGLTLWLVAAETVEVAEQWATHLGITHVVSNAMPNDKTALVQRLAENGFVAYVGDGIRDAVPMKLAQVAISLNGVSTLTQDTARVILLDQNPQHLHNLFSLSQRFEASMQRSLWLTTAPNAASIGGTFLNVVGYATSIGIFYSAMGVGLLNVFWPQLRRRYAALTAANKPKMINTSVTRITP
ncbi:ATPase, P-type (transporting), HAD superfamily, subfamily IC [Thiothrix caldifontis]|uniref:P-type Zn(2+) transporter n=1 Tax=Thiothrix caldifontis TaxID=525918 RepID=A0A1H4GU41_9GAMM|nr:HAD-IC family P-type ATPase [Thiothrix caldifontis]SEB12851.1 ATPase, P-type (transporting), HAD superfamily, subfamily IC [Thiothrix caldifontis]